MKHLRPTCVKCVSVNTCRQKEKNHWQKLKSRQVVEKESVSGKNVETKKNRQLADEEKQAGIQGQ